MSKDYLVTAWNGYPERLPSLFRGTVFKVWDLQSILNNPAPQEGALTEPICIFKVFIEYIFSSFHTKENQFLFVFK